MSDTTKKYRVKYWICTVISWLLVFGPLIAYAVLGFMQGQPHEKMTLGISIVVAIVCVALSILMKMHIRSTVFVLILGIYMCLDSVLGLILSISICTILDEAIMQPLQKMYGSKLRINKEIDKRIK